ncbi:TPA: hypothetical protein DCX16_05885 [bacterium]|nr:hypothetical protein [bacterium]
MGLLGSLIIHISFFFLSTFIVIYNQEGISEVPIEIDLITTYPEKPIIYPSVKKAKRLPFVQIDKTERLVKGFKTKTKLQGEGLLGEKKDKEEPQRTTIKPTMSIEETYGDILVGKEEGKEGKISISGEDEGGFGQGGSGIEITGQVARRQILYQEGFRLPEWVERRGVSLEGKFKLWVLPDGSVDRVLLEKSFGYRELDSLAISSISRWRFVRIQGTYEEWGFAVVKIKLR